LAIALKEQTNVSTAEVTVDALALKAALKQAGYVVNPRANLPIIQHVLLRAEVDRLVLTATNLDTWLETRVGAQVTHTGNAAVPYRVLVDVLKSASGAVTIAADLSDPAFPLVRLTTGRGTATINCLPADEFPMLPESTPMQDTAVAGLCEALAQVTPIASADPTRGVINSVRMEHDRLMATDTHRLVSLKHECGTPSWQPICLRRDLCEKLGKMLGCTPHAEVTVAANRNQAKFACGDTTVHSRLVEGQYPNFDKVIPTEPSGRIEVNPTMFSDALDWVEPVAREAANRVIVAIDGDLLAIHAESGIIGQADALCAVESQGTWREFRIALSCRYLGDGLALFAGCSAVTIQGNGPVNQVMLTSEERPEITYVAMPIQSG